jgi:hypothetical protein
MLIPASEAGTPVERSNGKHKSLLNIRLTGEYPVDLL